MPSWTTYKGLDVPDSTTGDAGTNLTDDLRDLADRAPYNFSGNPTVNDDSGDGFAAGSQWFNTSTQTMWVCTSAAAGAAKWRSLYRRVDNAVVLAPEAGVGGGDDARALQLDDSGDTRGTDAVDMQRTRSASSQVAAGARAAILGGENNRAFSTGSVVAGGKGNKAGGGEGTISNVATGNPATITSSSHGLMTGQTIAISGTTTTSPINGNRTVTWTGANTFTVPVNVTSVTVGTGSWTTSATAAYAFVAGGRNNLALGKSSHAEGYGTLALGNDAHAEGRGSRATGNISHAEGKIATASGYAAHAEGYNTTASGFVAHAEGNSTTASGYAAHAEGYNTTASGYAAHAEGHYTTAIGPGAHAEGGGYNGYTTASGYAAHAEGFLTVASGLGGHAGGGRSKAHLMAQWARAAGGHSNQLGTAQTTITHVFRRTTNATATELTLDGSTPSSASRFKILDGQTLSCFVNVVGRKENGGANDHSSFMRQVCIRREGSVTQIVGSVQTVGTDINPAGWGGVTITADDTNESLKIDVTGAASTDVRWMATVIASEVADADI